MPRPGLRSKTPPIQRKPKALPAELKWPWRGGDHSPPPGAEGKRVWSVPPLLHISSWRIEERFYRNFLFRKLWGRGEFLVVCVCVCVGRGRGLVWFSRNIHLCVSNFSTTSVLSVIFPGWKVSDMPVLITPGNEPNHQWQSRRQVHLQFPASLTGEWQP